MNPLRGAPISSTVNDLVGIVARKPVCFPKMRNDLLFGELTCSQQRRSFFACIMRRSARLRIDFGRARRIDYEHDLTFDLAFGCTSSKLLRHFAT